MIVLTVLFFPHFRSNSVRKTLSKPLEYSLLNLGVKVGGFWCQLNIFENYHLLVLGQSAKPKEVVCFLCQWSVQVSFWGQCVVSQNDVHNEVKDIQNSVSEEDKESLKDLGFLGVFKDLAWFRYQVESSNCIFKG